MTTAADPTLYWAVLARSRGEILTAEAQSPGLHLGLLGVPPGFSPRDVEGWLYDIIGVAHEGSPAPEAAGHIPVLLRHALTGLVFSHAELWDKGAGTRPCSFAFAHTVHEVGFGFVGDPEVRVWVDGEPVEPQWVAVRDEAGREARAWSIGSQRSVQVRIDWTRAGGEGCEVEAVWTAAPVARPVRPEGFAPAPVAEQAPSHEPRPESIPSDVSDAVAAPMSREPEEIAAGDTPSSAAATLDEGVPGAGEPATAIARWLRTGFSWLEGHEPEPDATSSSPISETADVEAIDPEPAVAQAEPVVGDPGVAPPVSEAAEPELPAPTMPGSESVDWPSMPERIPPTPEPAELTRRTVAWIAPPDPHAIELPPSRNVAPALPAPPAPPAPPVSDANDIEFHTVAVEPPSAAGRHTTPVIERPPVEPPVVERPLPPAEHVPAPPAPVAAAPPPMPVVTAPPAPPPAVVAPPAPSEPVHAVAPPPMFAPPPHAEPAAPKAAARRLVFQTTERPAWPTMGALTRADLPWWKRPWVWAIAVLVLFAGGWGLGTMQDNTGPRDVSHRGAFGAALHALGLGGPRFRVDVSSRPAGAWIAVDGRELSLRTPAAIELAPGEHEMTLSFSDLGGSTYKVRGIKGDRVPLEATLWGQLDVLSPEDVGVIAVSVDGELRGTAPLRVDSLAPGVHELRFSGPGVEPWGQTVDIRVGETHEVLARAVSSPANGVIQVKGTVTDEQGEQPLKGAQVWIDGDLRGTTPLTLDLPRGPHSVRAVYRGQEAPIQVIDLPGGNQRFAVFEFGLDAEPPRLTVDLPQRLPRDRSTVVSAALQGVGVPDAKEMWLHVEMPGGAWRRYQMTLLKAPGGMTGVTVFPPGAFDAQGRARWYVSALYGQGDEAFTEVRFVWLEKAGR